MLPAFFGVDIQVSLKAEPLFKLGPLTVTNSILYGVICSVLIAVLMIGAARLIKLRPQKGLIRNGIEYLVDFVINLLEAPFSTREAAARFAPIFGVYFVFIIFTNLMELLPVVGGTVFRSVAGSHMDLLRPFTEDLNGTIAMAVIAIVMVQYLSIKEQGLKNHLIHYFSDKPTNPLNFLIGLLEVFGELTRVMSLSLRLFLNTAVGGILIVVFTSLIFSEGRTPLAVLPIFMFEVLVAYIQAYVFTVLASTYLGLAISHTDHVTGEDIPDDPHHSHLDKVDVKGVVGG